MCVLAPVCRLVVLSCACLVCAVCCTCVVCVVGVVGISVCTESVFVCLCVHCSLWALCCWRLAFGLCVNIYVWMCMYVSMCMYVYVCVCVCVCVYVHEYICVVGSKYRSMATTVVFECRGHCDGRTGSL